MAPSRTPPTTEPELMVASLNERIVKLEAECVVVHDLIAENKVLKERLEQAEASKGSLLRLVWQHLETINRI